MSLKILVLEDDFTAFTLYSDVVFPCEDVRLVSSLDEISAELKSKCWDLYIIDNTIYNKDVASIILYGIQEWMPVAFVTSFASPLLIEMDNLGLMNQLKKYTLGVFNKSDVLLRKVNILKYLHGANLKVV